MNLKWNGEIGPSFLLVGVQTIGAIVAVTALYSSLSNTVANTKDTADRLSVIVNKVQDKNDDLKDRVTKVETNLDDLKTGVSKIADKIDRLSLQKQ